MTDDPDPARLLDEIGDLLFVSVNLARKMEIEAETALRHGNAKFERRFRLMEMLAKKANKDFPALDLETQEILWTEAKTFEKQKSE